MHAAIQASVFRKRPYCVISSGGVAWSQTFQTTDQSTVCLCPVWVTVKSQISQDVFRHDIWGVNKLVFFGKNKKKALSSFFPPPSVWSQIAQSGFVGNCPAWDCYQSFFCFYTDLQCERDNTNARCIQNTVPGDGKVFINDLFLMAVYAHEHNTTACAILGLRKNERN